MGISGWQRDWVAADGSQHPVSLQETLLSVLWKIRVQSIPAPSLSLRNRGREHTPRTKPPGRGGGAGVPKGGRELHRSQGAPSLLVSIFSFVVTVCVMQQSKGLITVGRLSPLETQLLSIYKSNVPQTSEPFGAATWGGFQESRHGALLQQEDKSPFWPPIFIFPSPSLSFSRGQINDLQLWMLPCLFLYFFLPKKPRIVKAACANENINI